MGKSKKNNRVPPPPQPPVGSTTNPNLQPPRGNANIANVVTQPVQQPQIPQGEFYDYLWYCQNRINIYAAVDSWRSYRDGTNNLQTATNFQSFSQPHASFLGNDQQQAYHSAQQGANANGSRWPHPQVQLAYPQQVFGQPAYSVGRPTVGPVLPQSQSAPQPMHPHYQTHTAPRLVHNYARYPSYRVNKSYRGHDDPNEGQRLQQDKKPAQSPTKDPRRYKPRPRETEQKDATNNTVVDAPPRADRFSRQEVPPRRLFQSTLTLDEDHRPSVSSQRYPLRSRQGDRPVASSSVASDRLAPSIEASRGLPLFDRSLNVRPPTAPKPSTDYKKNAEMDPVSNVDLKKLLVVLDLNGTLLVRPNKRRPTHIIVRPGVGQFLDYLFRNHVVMVYSSAKPQNCAVMIEKFFRPDQRSVLAAVWARDKLDLTYEQYEAKVQVYKKLEPIWRDQKIQNRAGPGQCWDQSNTVLVDDSRLKALAQPHNLLQIPEFLNNEPATIQARLDWHRSEEAIVMSVQQKLEELKWQVDVSRLIREWQTGKKQAPGVVDETVDYKALQGNQDRSLSPTPTPSASDRELSQDPEQLQNAGTSPMSTTEDHLPQCKPAENDDDGVSSGENGGIDLADLEANINRNLSLSQNSPELNHRQLPARQTDGVAMAAGSVDTTDQAPRPSESPASQDIRTDGASARVSTDGAASRDNQDAKGKNKARKASRTKGTQKGAKENKRSHGYGKAGSDTVKEEKSAAQKSAPMTPESLGS